MLISVEGAKNKNPPISFNFNLLCVPLSYFMHFSKSSFFQNCTLLRAVMYITTFQLHLSSAVPGPDMGHEARPLASLEVAVLTLVHDAQVLGVRVVLERSPVGSLEVAVVTPGDK